jgi:hypothetical protein
MRNQSWPDRRPGPRFIARGFRWNQVTPESGEGKGRYRDSPDEEKQGAGVKQE